MWYDMMCLNSSDTNFIWWDACDNEKKNEEERYLSFCILNAKKLVLFIYLFSNHRLICYCKIGPNQKQNM